MPRVLSDAVQSSAVRCGAVPTGCGLCLPAYPQDAPVHLAAQSWCAFSFLPPNPNPTPTPTPTPALPYPHPCPLPLPPPLPPPLTHQCIDFYALRAHQYTWLHDFVDQWGGDTSLAVLPNFCFALAQARLGEAEGDGEGDRGEGSGEAANGVTPAGRIRAAATAAAAPDAASLLRDALFLHPYVSCHPLYGQVKSLKPWTLLIFSPAQCSLPAPGLVEKAPIKTDTSWTSILKHPLFARTTPGSASLEHLVRLYVERSAVLWRGEGIQTLLKRVAGEVVATVERERKEGSGDGEMESWKCVREVSFPSGANA
ncbi:unnamed protein product [Closterium sp. NIES-53]